jgi:uncharacterized protein (TIGR00369 family)
MSTATPLPGLPGTLGIQLTYLGTDRVTMTLTVSGAHLVPDAEHVHAGTLVTLADTACGYGCRHTLPDGATGFITLELKANLLRSAAVGDHLLCTATPTHRGRRTHVWDAAVTLGDVTKPLALFRCTQLIL